MDKKNRPQEKPQGEASNQTKRGKITQKQWEKIQLEKILGEHQEWLESEGGEGKQANLQGAYLIAANLQRANLMEANLQEANLTEANLQRAQLMEANLQEVQFREANLQGADLRGADLRGANLGGANLRGAYLMEANLQEANLERANLRGAYLMEANLQEAFLAQANLRDATLQDANLTEGKGLLGTQLAGANVSGTKLPEDIHKFEGLATVEEASKNARKLFFAMLLGCVYTVLTIATTTDARLLTKSASSPLPIIGTQIPIVGFYWAAPLLLLGLYLYFHIYLQRLWEGLAELPAVLPDGRPLYKKAYPWLLNSLVCAHFKLLRSDRPYLSRLQVFLSIILAWWVVPATLLLIWLRYLPRHHWVLTVIQVILLGLSIGMGFILQRLARVTLRGKQKNPFLWKKILAVVLGTLGVVFIFFLLSFGAIEGAPFHEATGIRRWTPIALGWIGFHPLADLAEVEVSIKPPNWTGKDKDIALVKGANLKKMNLNYAYAFRAFLVRADLRWAKLIGANLQEANLQEANLTAANLQRAHLREANLQGADLEFANLLGADLTGANLRGAKKITVKQLSKARTLYDAKLDPGLRKQIKTDYRHLLKKPKP